MPGFDDDDFDVEGAVGWDAANAAYERTKDIAGTGIVPAGQYLATVEKVWPETSRKNKPVLRVRFRVVQALSDTEDEDPEAQKGQTVLLTLNLTAAPRKEFALARTRQFEEAVGFVGEVKRGKGAEDLALHAVGELVRIDISIGTYQTEEQRLKHEKGTERSQVDKISSASAEDASDYVKAVAKDNPWDEQ